MTDILEKMTGIMWNRATTEECLQHFGAALSIIPSFATSRFKRINAVKILWIDNDQFPLYAKHINQDYRLPGGKPEKGETVDWITLKRELMEEMNVEPRSCEFLCTILQFNTENGEPTMYTTQLYTSDDPFAGHDFKAKEYDDAAISYFNFKVLREHKYKVPTISPLTLTQLCIADIKLNPELWNVKFQFFKGTLVVNLMGEILN